MKPSPKKRSALKAATWRILASLDTFVISYIITGKVTWATAIASIEVLTKMILYYIHERGWSRIEWGK
tara:strand:- start:874 stop:1077 length:204 start_codon:yes stop_codon:yes gene_type:complete